MDDPDYTFELVTREWLADQAPLWSAANAFRVQSRLEKDIFPAVGKLAVSEIDGPTVLKALRAIEARGAIETAKRVRGYVLAILKRAHAEGRIPAAVVHSVECIGAAMKPAMPVVRLPALTTVAELLDLQRAVDCSTAGSVIKLASRFLALTVPRVGVLRQAVWSEFEGIDWSNEEEPSPGAIWRIPAQRMKLDMEDKLQPEFGHDIPLSRQAVDVLRAVRTLTGRFEYVFIHSRSWRDPMSDASLSSLYKRLGSGRFKNRMVPHGWRTAFSTIMNERAAELNRPGERILIDMALAHVPEGVSASEWAYNRASYLKPRAVLYQAWADIIILEDIKDLTAALKRAPPGRRLPALVEVDELLEFQRAVDRSAANILTKLASRFLALTLVRVGTLCQARWSEIEGIDWSDPAEPAELPIWRIPPANMKLKTADKGISEFGHDVPLSVEAVATLRVVRRLSGHAEYIFPRMTAWRNPMSTGALNGLYKTMAGGIYKDRMVPHGWRSAFSTLMNERAALRDRHGDRLVIDMILGHMPNGVTASEWAYNRARYLKPKAALLQAWSDMISKDLQLPEALLRPTTEVPCESG